MFTCNTASNDTGLGKERKFCICNNALNDTELGKERRFCICNTSNDTKVKRETCVYVTLLRMS